MNNLPVEIQAARLKLAKTHPYLASALWAMVPVAKPGLQTMAIDMFWRLYFDPEVVNRWSVEEIAGVLYHEVQHLLRNHPERLKNEDRILGNIAKDAEINDDLLTEGILLPGTPVTPQGLGLPENLLAEEYYEKLLEKRQHPGSQSNFSETKAGGDGDSKEGDGENSMSSSSSSQSASASASSEELSCSSDSSCSDSGSQADNRLPEEEETTSSIPSPGMGRCGSCATGTPEPWEDAPPNQGDPGVSPVEAELIRREVARQILNHSRSQGNVPGYWKRWAEEKLQPKVNWRKQLASCIRYAIADIAGASDYSYKKPSRRQRADIVLPSLRQPVPNIAVVVDTSGSISDQMLAEALAEVKGILKALGYREGIQVLSVDSAVHTCQKVYKAEQVKLAGGGGTNMGAGIKRIEKLKPRPQVCVVITDGYTPWPDNKPAGMKVIVVLTDSSGSSPDWAKTVKIAGS